MQGKRFGMWLGEGRGNVGFASKTAKNPPAARRRTTSRPSSRPLDQIQVKPGGRSPPQTNLIRVGVGWQCASSSGSKRHRRGHACAVGSLVRRGNKYSVFK